MDQPSPQPQDFRLPHHDSYTDEHIRSILGRVKTIAMVGATPNTARPAYFVLRYLLQKGYRVIPVNPGQAGREVLGVRFVASLADIGEPVDMVDVFRRPEFLGAIVDQVLAMEPLPKVLWMQLGVRNDAAAARAEAAGITVVMNRCPKIEYARLCGEISWAGVNSRVIGSAKPKMSDGYQHFGLVQNRAEGGKTG